MFERQTLVCHGYKVCRGVCDRFCESTYENKTGMITNNAMVICRKDKYCHSRF